MVYENPIEQVNFFSRFRTFWRKLRIADGRKFLLHNIILLICNIIRFFLIPTKSWQTVKLSHDHLTHVSLQGNRCPLSNPKPPNTIVVMFVMTAGCLIAYVIRRFHIRMCWKDWEISPFFPSFLIQRKFCLFLDFFEWVVFCSSGLLFFVEEVGPIWAWEPALGHCLAA